MAIYNPDAPRRLPLSRREKLIRAVGAIVLLGTTAWLLANWGSLPVRLPSHYGFGGEIDGWSGRGLPVTDRTRPMLYCLMGEMLTVLQLVIALIFAFLSVWPLTFRPLPGWWWPVFLGSLFGSQGWYLWRAVRLGRTPPRE